METRVGIISNDNIEVVEARKELEDGLNLELADEVGWDENKRDDGRRLVGFEGR